METAKRSTPGARSTDRVLEALSTLAAFLDRTINEVKTLDSEFQSRLQQAVHDTEISLQSQAAQQFETALNETRTRLEEQFKQELSEFSARRDAERDRLNKELERALHAATQWEVERVRLNGEIDRLSRETAVAQAEARKADKTAKEAAQKAAAA